MRTLNFLVNGNEIIQDPSCNFSGLFPGSNEEIEAQFIFSHDWDGLTKVASFWSMLDHEYPPAILDSEGKCVIPAEVLKRTAFKIQVLGKSRRGIIFTDKLIVHQRGVTK